MTEPLTGAELQELDDLVELTKTRGWRVFKNLLHKHRTYCIEQAHKCLESHCDRQAGEWLARSKEPHKAINLIEKRKQEISDQREKENG